MINAENVGNSCSWSSIFLGDHFFLIVGIGSVHLLWSWFFVRVTDIFYFPACSVQSSTLPVRRLDSASAVWCFKLVLFTISKSCCINCSRPRTSFHIVSVRFRIHCNARWSVLRINLLPSKLESHNTTAHRTARHLRCDVSRFFAWSVGVLDK